MCVCGCVCVCVCVCVCEGENGNIFQQCMYHKVYCFTLVDTKTLVLQTQIDIINSKFMYLHESLSSFPSLPPTLHMWLYFLL